MAGRIKEFTGINPFTIDQEKLTERYTAGRENPFYKLININEPSVFVEKDGKVFNGLEGSTVNDVRVAHPRTQYIHGRPDWLLMNGKRKPFRVKPRYVRTGFPSLVLAYAFGEDPTKAVPVDVVEITNKQDQKALILAPGNYSLVVQNIRGDRKIFTIEVK